MAKIGKIIKVIEPTEEDNWRGGLYSVYFEHMPTQRVIMTKARYEMIKFEGELYSKGVEVKDILKYRHLVEDAYREERIEEDRCF